MISALLYGKFTYNRSTEKTNNLKQNSKENKNQTKKKRKFKIDFNPIPNNLKLGVEEF